MTHELISPPLSPLQLLYQFGIDIGTDSQFAVRSFLSACEILQLIIRQAEKLNLFLFIELLMY